MVKRSVILCFAALGLASCDGSSSDPSDPGDASASPGDSGSWPGILDPARATDWSRAGAGEIPPRAAQCGSTIAAYAGPAMAINTAIAACPPGQHVQLGSGTFALTSSIRLVNTPNVTLRGAGPDQTFLIFSGHGNAGDCGPAAICVAPATLNYPDGPHNTASWTDGYQVGATELTLSSVANLAVDSQMILDQLDDTADNGGYWVCGERSGVGTCCSSCASGIGRLDRGQLFVTKVTALRGNTVTIADPLIHPNWRSDRQPGAWWAGSGAAQPMIIGVGIEDLSIDITNLGTGGQFGIVFGNAYGGWVKNIRSVALKPTLGGNDDVRSQLRFYQSAHITVRDSYFYGKPGASGNYGFETYMGSSNLLENNIGECNSTTVTDANSASVFSYNYFLNDCYINYNWMQPGHAFHSPGNAFLLMEGNDSAGLQLDVIHGTADFITGFRNRWHGWEPGKQLQTVAVNNYANSRYTNLIGNVLGEPLFHTTYETAAGGDATSCPLSIFALGWGGNCGSGSVPDDLKVKSTMMRWGNYDTVSAAARFEGGEVPSADPFYANASPASHELPRSFYLVARPAWWATPWGTPAWPLVGPDVSGGDLPNSGGMANKSPAQLCYENSPSDPAYATSFAVTAASWAASTGPGGLPGRVTLTIGNNNIAIGTAFSLGGVTPATFNGSYLVYAQTPTTITFGRLSDPGPYVSGGTVNAPNVRLFNAAHCYGQ